MDLRERARHHRVLGGRDKLQPHLVVVAAHVFAVGSVEHQQHVRRQLLAQPPHLLERHVGAGRVVRVGQEHDLGARRDALEQLVHVGGVVEFRRDDRLCPARHDRDRIDEETMRRVEALVAGAEIAAREQVQQIVRARPAHDPVGIEPVGRSDRQAQGFCRAVRIALQLSRHRLVGRRSPSGSGPAASRSTTA